MPSLSIVWTPVRRWFPSRPGDRVRIFAGLLASELLALLALIAFLLVTARGSDEFLAPRTLLAEPDLPPGWVPVPADTYPFMEDSSLVRLLLEEETVAGAFSAYRDPTDSSTVASYVIYRPDDPLTLADDPTKDDLTPFALLVTDMERLARQRLSGALPEVSFAVSDVPVPGALRGRSLAPVTEEGVQSDFIVFTTGSVLALVVEEHPRGEEPFQSIEELARIVHSRLLEELS